MARCLRAPRRAPRAWVVHGGGLDELSLCGPTHGGRVRGRRGRAQRSRSRRRTPASAAATREALRGGDAARERRASRASVLDGEPRTARATWSLLNAAAALRGRGPGRATCATGVAQAAARHRRRPRPTPSCERVRGGLPHESSETPDGVLGRILARTRERVARAAPRSCPLDAHAGAGAHARAAAGPSRPRSAGPGRST